MAKSFKKSNPLDNIDNQAPAEPVAAVEHEAPHSRPEEPKKKSKGKVGRPKTKTEDCKTINIAIPLSVLAKMEIAKSKYGDNLTKYVNEVVTKDLDANMETYQQIYDLLHQ